MTNDQVQVVSDDNENNCGEEINTLQEIGGEELNDEDENESDEEWKGEEEPSSESCDDILCTSDQEHIVDDLHYDSDTCNHERLGIYKRDDGNVDPNSNIPIIIHHQVDDGGKIELMAWQSFKDYKAFASVLDDFAIQEWFELEKLKFERTRVTAKCRAKNCPWRVHASFAPDKLSFLIKKINSMHTCVAVRTNKHVTSAWISKKLALKLRENPDIPIDSMRTWLKNDYGIEVDNLRLWRARKMIRCKTEGDHKESFRKLRWYAEMILTTNPGSIAIVKSRVTLESNNNEDENRDDAVQPSNICIDDLPSTRYIVPTFLRIFVCFDGVKQGLLQGCRPFIGVDGCHLKGPYKGVLLSAVGVDANLQFFPLAYAIVEAENKISWVWFMTELRNAIGENNNGIPWCVMSDRQKGILDATPVLPGSLHRFCCYHLRNNYHKQFGNVELRNKFWAVAETANFEKFKRVMEEIKNLNKDAHRWLSNIPSQHWSLSCFENNHKVEHLTNNLTESFNGWVDKLRFKRKN